MEKNRTHLYQKHRVDYHKTENQYNRKKDVEDQLEEIKKEREEEEK